MSKQLTLMANKQKNRLSLEERVSYLNLWRRYIDIKNTLINEYIYRITTKAYEVK